MIRERLDCSPQLFLILVLTCLFRREIFQPFRWGAAIGLPQHFIVSVFSEWMSLARTFGFLWLVDRWESFGVSPS